MLLFKVTIFVLIGFFDFVSAHISNVSANGSPNYTNMIRRVFDDIQKHPVDNRTYRGFELKNGLRLFLISDLTVDHSSAALTVGVGEKVYKFNCIKS